MSYVDLLGLFAAILTSASFIPQAILVLRTRNTDGISVTMYTIFVLGVLVWIVYGVAIASWPLVIANIVTFSFSSIIWAITLRNKLKK